MGKPFYKVWVPADGDETDAEVSYEDNPPDAAEMYVSDNHSQLDYPDEVIVNVKSIRDGSVQSFTVTVEETITFHASKNK